MCLHATPRSHAFPLLHHASHHSRPASVKLFTSTRGASKHEWALQHPRFAIFKRWRP